jgi:anti-anti-sigma factor
MDLVSEPGSQTVPRAEPGHPADVEGERGLTRVTVRSGVTFLVVQTNSIREHQATLIDRELQVLEEQTGGRVALCLSQVDDMCSAFINVLIQTDHRCGRRSGLLVVFGLNHELERLFRTTGLSRRLVVARDCNHALRKLRNSEPRRLAMFLSWFHRQAA